MARTLAENIELQNLTSENDIESMAPSVRKPIWYRSATLLSFATAYRLGKSTSFATGNSNDSCLEPSRAAFILEITNKKLDSEAVSCAAQWYCSFLEYKIKEAWVPLCGPLLCNSGTQNEPYKEDYASEEDITNGFQFLTTIAKQFQRKDLALTDIVDAAYNNRLLRETDPERSMANQLAFAMVGWISMLYDPVSQPEQYCFQIYDPFEVKQASRAFHQSRLNTDTLRKLRCKSKSLMNFRQSLEQNDQPLYALLRSFGKIVPQQAAQRPNPSNLTTINNYEEFIDPSLICYYTLRKFVSVKIEWASSLTEHLEFDGRTKILKMFRFPSLCVLMCSNPSRSLLSQIFQDSANHACVSGSDFDNARKFFHEVLLSYRLIFSQTKGSHRTFNKQYKLWKKEWEKTSSLTLVDPMLERLCGNVWHSEQALCVWDELGIEPPNDYDLVSDFPYLGRRLEEIQRYVQRHSVRALWYNRRDISWWWTFWAVIIVGGGTLVLGILQVVLQILQLILAEKQLGQNSGLP